MDIRLTFVSNRKEGIIPLMNDTKTYKISSSENKLSVRICSYSGKARSIRNSTNSAIFQLFFFSPLFRCIQIKFKLYGNSSTKFEISLKSVKTIFTTNYRTEKNVHINTLQTDMCVGNIFFLHH